MSSTNLRHLRVFEAVARLSSFVEASKALHMTPAAVSLAIRDLETSLEFRVFDRTTRYVRLTEAGKQYFERVVRVLTEVRAAESCASSLRKGSYETVRIATTPTVITSLLGVAFERAPTLWPNVRINCIEVMSHQLPEVVDAGIADIAIGVRLPNNESTESQLLFASRWTALIRRDNKLARKHPLTWREVVAETVVVTNQSSRLAIQKALPADVTIELAHEVSTAMSAIAYAASGQGIAIVPGYMRQLAKAHKLVAVPIVEPEVLHMLEIANARRPKPEPHVLRIRDFLLSEVPSVYRKLV
ncbi:LysR family transcriptional regulator [Trinickia caryophylli]|uniref:Transcriptional regulator, LysR family n=1 Tax=Trinickia caryophylli TaxID=28094 RepID=A0A1X7H9M6_TRICW|nr:LysR family transcriptional regulator [Trinickia caryophylli]PMS09474.1 LysR family transcriptional regulator [Trinickia caryophylli]TRX14093.1 LysR family transcriptional regulator [Trinickia caryophylli]WQE13913.1 LysR family transcriptional regulator [Trinickia caryophylli]SMF81374.1 transcriptional regulator, LysR family [Trinickia caryophylli]GLU35744.1 LysR family transcriptional regulator [Trinickia caryophylli]